MSRQSSAEASAFHLEVDGQGLGTLTFDLPGRKVNLFTRAALEELAVLVEGLAARTDIRGLVFLSTKEGSFCHGLDIGFLEAIATAEEAEAGALFGQGLLKAWEELPFPTIAVLDGSCLGSGLELALASTYRVASDREDLRLGFPEIRLGIVPAWGGCLRLPRRIGLGAALDAILNGTSLPPWKAHKMGLVEAVFPAAGFLDAVRAFALEHRDDPRQGHGAGDPKELPLESDPQARKRLFDQARKKALERGGRLYPAPLRAIEVIRTGLEKGRRAGLAAAARAVGDLAIGAQCKNLLHCFRLTHEAKRHPAFEFRPAFAVAPRPATIERAAVVGAGVMGRSIAYLLADQGGLPVHLKDLHRSDLAEAMDQVGALVENRRSRRRLTSREARRLMARIQPCVEVSDFGAVDLVVEAVPERLELKRRELAAVAAVVPPTTILASNTSSLSIDALAEGVPHPERVLGLHFLNPAYRMPLVEIVAGRRTAPEVVVAAVELSHRLGKTPVAVRDAPGFLVNRLLTFYLSGALWLLDEGYGIAELDRALIAWGMPQGPFALMDRVGIDLAVEVGNHLMAAFGERLTFPDWDWSGVFLEEGRLGEKSGAGFYRYENGRRQDPDPDVPRRLGLANRKPRGERTPTAWVDRLLLPMVNEAARCLEEEVVATAGDLDVAVLLGLGFPAVRGGLCRWADQRGLEEIVNALEAPSEALRRLAGAGGFYGRESGPSLAYS
jgi:3-hydroxyacyl-CoA dehydrogenase / enoyl-CoA hydratase / 3-hydroxybutyryl-CoA epimerase